MYKNELWENDNYSHNPEVVGSNPAPATITPRCLGIWEFLFLRGGAAGQLPRHWPVPKIRLSNRRHLSSAC